MGRSLLHPALLSPEEVAERTAVSVSTARRWIDSGLLPATRTPGKHRKVSKADLETFMRARNLQVPGARRRLLIIEDDTALLKALKQVLAVRAPDLEVDIASNATQGLLLVGVKRPDVVLLDGLMDGLDGFEACRFIKSTPETASIKVIGISADAKSEARFQKAGVDAYLQKPFSASVVVEMLRLVGAFQSVP